MEKARCNTELYSNLRAPLNNVKPSNFWGSHHNIYPPPTKNRKDGKQKKLFEQK